MRSSISILSAVVLAFSFACSKSANVSTSNANPNVNQPVANANKPEPEANTSTDAPVAGSLATPSDAYRTAYALREKKDLAGLKKVMSKDVLDFLTAMADEGKTLDDQIKDIFDKPQAKTAETRNEKINGDRGSVEYLDEEGKWKTMDFVKEGGDWKMALPAKDDIEVDTGTPSKKPAKP